KSLILLAIGFAFTVEGADFAVESASNIARSLGVSEWVIGLLLVAFGTSLPELVVSIVAALKNNADMAIGNIIGSNVANLSIVLGSAAIVNPLTIDVQANLFDIIAAVTVSIMLIFITANKLYNKSAGIVLLTTTALVLYHAILNGHA
ncbi:MAG: sodium:calcium antiporter, partial [Epsilonproteobacteria bacterium]|nr:sodium:calcium antiporter [Campylobacterota bacterium]